jgi:predicted Zn-dependent protease
LGTSGASASALLALLLAAGLACARNPATGRPEVVLVSSATERKLGEEGALEVERAIGLYRAADLEAYVAALGARLAAASPRQDVPYSFRIVDAIEPNAFALPGGPTYVSRGLLALANREDELACVVAHEVAHVAARHAVGRASAQAPFALAFGLPAAILRTATLGLAGNLIGSVGALASGLVIAPYSREQEREADRLGMEIAARAGWDPAALVGILRTLERDEALRANAEARRPSFFATHPSLPSRVADAEKHSAGLPRTRVAPVAASPEAFLQQLAGLLVGPDARQGVFVESRFLHPDLAFAIDFPKGWKTANTAEVVAAAEPKGEALVSLQLSVEGDDPLDGARADGVGENLFARIESHQQHGLAAASLGLDAKDSRFELSWIAYAGRVYRVAGVREARASGHDPVLRAAATSFRPLAAGDRDAIVEQRLAIESARGGESVASLVARAKSAWSAEQVAVANALEPGSRLAAGQPVKIAVERRYAAAR